MKAVPGIPPTLLEMICFFSTPTIDVEPFLRLKEKIGEFRTEKLDFQKEGPLTPKTAVWEMHMAHFTKSCDSNPQTFKKT